jgi:hypothetical protein
MGIFKNHPHHFPHNSEGFRDWWGELGKNNYPHPFPQTGWKIQKALTYNTHVSKLENKNSNSSYFLEAYKQLKPFSILRATHSREMPEKR